MRLDDFLPEFDRREVHALTVNAPRERVWRAAREVTADEIPLLRHLMNLRTLRGRTLGGSDRLSPGRPVIDVMQSLGFTLVAEEPERELVAVTVGKFWRLDSGLRPVESADEFARFDEPGWARAGFNLHLAEAGQGTRLSTETRIKATDARARRLFGAYWLLIRPWSGLTRRAWLRAIARRATVAASPRGDGVVAPDVPRANVELVAELHRRQREMYLGGPAEPVLAVLDPEIVWHVPGHSPIAGDHRGPDAVLRYFTTRRELAGATMQMYPGAVLSDEHAVVQLVNGSAELNGKSVEWRTVGVYRIEDGRVAEVWLVPLDLAEFDRIWTPPATAAS